LTARDRVAFRSDLLPVEHFDERFSDDNLAFWVPLIVEAARIGPDPPVLDVGCGTGGFSRAIAERASAAVTGLDSSSRFIAFANALPAPRRGAVDWVVGDAERLRLEDASFDRVLLSLVLHQLADPEAAVGEAFRVLAAGGLALVRTIAPEDAVERVPERYLPSMAAADASRLPEIAAVEQWLARAGFGPPVTRRVPRNKRLSLADEERQLLVEVRSRYPFIGAEELEEGLRRMRADAQRAGEWIDPRPTYLLAASKPG
jgi:ubiquinone/menaquinone biosynthesis C-methylase UbiE